ncbi:SLBB domain-containing protein [bacterium]|nr:SLBB domain-containing protein [bacterium]
MKHITIIFFLLISIGFSQSLTNSQLDKIKKELTESSEIITAPEVELEKFDFDPDAVTLTSKKSINVEEDFFGYDYFRKDYKIYDNIPTPSNYVLGPGDNITISMWGESNMQTSLTLNKNGSIFYGDIGFINLSNKTIKDAEILLKEKLSSIYSTLKDENNSTSLSIEVGKLKSINIFFTGNIANPGINLIHPFSDIFSAISQAGGINRNGSLRTVQLIRAGKVINTVDFYSFFMEGNNTFSNIKLIDGDIIHIPSVNKRVFISGSVNRSSNFELLNNESLSKVLFYASGLTSDASSDIKITQIIPFEDRTSNDNARSSITMNLKDKDSIILNNGDSIYIKSISLVDLDVEVYGKVKSPGPYPAFNTTLKNVLDVAGGFDDPTFRQSIREDEIIILRPDSNQFYSKEIKISYKDADQFKLEPNDKIFVYEDINYRNSFTYRIQGEVFKPGTYPFKAGGITVQEAVTLAGGITELSSERNISIKQDFTYLDDDGNQIRTSEVINNVSLDFEIGINSVITLSPFENVVRVIGNVYNPGLITYQKGKKLPRYIELAGGHKPNSIKRKVYIKRANGNIEQSGRITLGLGKNIYPGDTIYVPLNENPQDFDITSFISDISTTLANIAAILLIVDNQTD